MLLRVLRTGVDLTGLDAGGMPTGPNSTIEDCKVAEVAPDGGVVWQWSALDHFDPVKVSRHAGTALWPSGAPLPDGGIVSVFWCTSVDVDPTNGNILIASRAMDSILHIDRFERRWTCPVEDGGGQLEPGRRRLRRRRGSVRRRARRAAHSLVTEL